MVKRGSLKAVCAGAALSALVALTAPAGAAEPAEPVGPTRPNILLVNLDDARHDALDHLPKTRAWLYGTGRRYTSARVAIPSCCPSRSALFTGRFPHNNGVRLQEQGGALTRDRTLMRYLDDAGYLNAMSGKFLINWTGRTPPPYFDRWTLILGGYYDYDAWVDSATPRRESTYSTTFLAARLRGYLQGFEAQDAVPWFAYWAPQAPHTESGWKKLATPETTYAAMPVAPCARPGETALGDKPGYVANVPFDRPYTERMCASQIRTLRSVDDEIDRTLLQLRNTGELADTMVVLTSDNGYHWGENSWMTKFTPYEASVRVPLVVRWDGHVTPGVDTRLVSTVDILPTILGVLGRTPITPLDGRSLLTSSPRARVLSEYFNDPANGSAPTWAALTTPTRKYVENQVRRPDGTTRVVKELYRLDVDPGEQVNVLRDGTTSNDPSPAMMQTWASQLAAARTCVGLGCP